MMALNLEILGDLRREIRWLLSRDCEARSWAGSRDVSIVSRALRRSLTVVDKDIVQDRNQVRNEVLILKMVDDGDDILSFDNSGTVLVGVRTRVANDAQSMDLDAMLLLFGGGDDIEEELEYPRLAIWDSPGHYVMLVDDVLRISVILPSRLPSPRALAMPSRSDSGCLDAC
jgi:hypothetical protein